MAAEMKGVMEATGEPSVTSRATGLVRRVETLRSGISLQVGS